MFPCCRLYVVRTMMSLTATTSTIPALWMAPCHHAHLAQAAKAATVVVEVECGRRPSLCCAQRLHEATAKGSVGRHLEIRRVTAAGPPVLPTQTAMRTLAPRARAAQAAPVAVEVEVAMHTAACVHCAPLAAAGSSAPRGARGCHALSHRRSSTSVPSRHPPCQQPATVASVSHTTAATVPPLQPLGHCHPLAAPAVPLGGHSRARCPMPVPCRHVATVATVAIAAPEVAAVVPPWHVP